MIRSPLSVQVSKKRKFILNLNTYRNTHFHVLNKAKVVYKSLITSQIEALSLYTRVKIIYTYYPKTKRRTDLGNVLSVHQKFFEDAFVEGKKIEDDDYLHIIGSIQRFGEVDKEDPRVEIVIIEVNE